MYADIADAVDDPTLSDLSENQDATNSSAARWRSLASATAGSLLGVPFIATGMFRGFWAEISHWMTAFQK